MFLNIFTYYLLLITYILPNYPLDSSTFFQRFPTVSGVSPDLRSPGSWLRCHPVVFGRLSGPCLANSDRHRRRGDGGDWWCRWRSGKADTWHLQIWMVFRHVKDMLLVGGFKHDWMIFHFIYGMSSETHWRTHTFQDGYRWAPCTTNQVMRNMWISSFSSHGIS
jgi:hypothetical protein